METRLALYTLVREPSSPVWSKIKGVRGKVESTYHKNENFDKLSILVTMAAKYIPFISSHVLHLNVCQMPRVGKIITGYVLKASQNSYPVINLLIYSLFLVSFMANYRPHLGHFLINDFLTPKVPKSATPLKCFSWKCLKR